MYKIVITIIVLAVLIYLWTNRTERKSTFITRQLAALGALANLEEKPAPPGVPYNNHHKNDSINGRHFSAMKFLPQQPWRTSVELFSKYFFYPLLYKNGDERYPLIDNKKNLLYKFYQMGVKERTIKYQNYRNETVNAVIRIPTNINSDNKISKIIWKKVYPKSHWVNNNTTHTYWNKDYGHINS